MRLLSSAYVRAVEMAHVLALKPSCAIAPHLLRGEFSALDAVPIERVVKARQRPLADSFREAGGRGP